MTSPIGNVVERRKPAQPSDKAPITFTSSRSGFPVVGHRARKTNAFVGSQQSRITPDIASTPTEGPSSLKFKSSSIDVKNSIDDTISAQDFARDISQASDEVLQQMSEEQREEARHKIVEHYGPGIKELIQKVKEARERRSTRKLGTKEGVSSRLIESSEHQCEEPSAPIPARTRKIRFQEPTPADIHVYDSHPSSPKRTIALLPPPPVSSGSVLDVISLGNLGCRSDSLNESKSVNMTSSSALEEGTPEDIHQRFFPHETPPESNPNLAWMLDNKEQTSDAAFVLEPRYALSGQRLTPSEIRDLPIHLGLHHHSSNDSPTNAPAGYTIDELLLLSRSSFPAQRASIFGVLTNILKVAYKECFYETKSPDSHALNELDNKRRDFIDSAIYALSEKGTVGLRAKDVLWEGVVGMTLAELQISVVEQLPYAEFGIIAEDPTLHSLPASSNRLLSFQSLKFLTSFPLKRILPTIRSQLLTSSSLVHSHLLDILFVLAHFREHAKSIADCGFDNGILSAILTPHLQYGEESVQTSSLMLKPIFVLQQLALSGRDIATSLLASADILLKYIVIPMPGNDDLKMLKHESILRLALLQETFAFYSLLAQYGLYAHIATVAQIELTNIANWLLTTIRHNCHSEIITLATNYFRFLERMIVCGHDPHKTTPMHEILWSQIRAWRWVDWIFDFADAACMNSYLTSDSASGCLHDFWSSLLHCLGAWLEGATINEIKEGKEAKKQVADKCHALLLDKSGVATALDDILTELRAIPDSTLTSDVLRTMGRKSSFLLGVLKVSDQFFGSEMSPLFCSLVERIYYYCKDLLKKNFVRNVLDFSYNICSREDILISLRPITSLLVVNFHVSVKFLPGIESKEQIILTAVQLLASLLPGDESLAWNLIRDLCNTIDSSFIQAFMLHINLKKTEWPEKGLHLLLPFYRDSLCPPDDAVEPESVMPRPEFIGPFSPTPNGLSKSSRLLMPSLSFWYHKWSAYEKDFILPLKNDWPTWPINHLLRSGSSHVFQRLPPSWDANETDVVRLTLLLVRVLQALAYKGGEKAMKISISRPEVVFTCMKVFMLEHGLQQTDSSTEVFRDTFVAHVMEDLLEPFSYANSCNSADSLGRKSLEEVSRSFLGDRMPFFQFYTDFLALYDAISFANPLFGRLLIPPLSMNYPLDYRKLLFGDFNHILRTIRTNPREVYSDDLRDYFWPIECDQTMVGWYFKSVVQSSVQGFLYLICVHHLASNIWPDLGGAPMKEHAKSLLKALLARGTPQNIKEVVLYNQSRHSIVFPPNCFEGQNIGESRWRYIKVMGDRGMEDSLQALFID